MYAERIGWVRLAVTLGGEHVQHSPAELEVAAAGAVPGACYAFGPGFEAPAPAGPLKFTIVSCDVSGVQRSVGGDAFSTLVAPCGQSAG